MNTYVNEFNQKLVSANTAVKEVKSGDWVAYSHFAMFPETLDGHYLSGQAILSE